MAHRPLMVVPDFCGGMLISVSPEDGRLFRYSKAGMLIAEEQSNVPLVIIFNVVWVSALAIVFLGKYPPLAFIVMVCFPSTKLTLFIFSDVELSLFPPAIKIEAPMIIMPIMMDDVIAFIDFILSVLLKAENWRYYALSD